MPLYYDITDSHSQSHISGLTRVSAKLGHALRSQIFGDGFCPVKWGSFRKAFFSIETKDKVELTEKDTFLTPELFSKDERKGFLEALKESGCRSAAIFHDMIPISHFEITWPKSVLRHPAYMESLLQFDQIFAVSHASMDALQNYWDSLDIINQPPITVLPMGADFCVKKDVGYSRSPSNIPLVLCTGILEPRKCQDEVLNVAKKLWDEGLEFELHFLGRVNPYFGKPVEKRIKKAASEGYSVFHHQKQSDGELIDLYSKAHFSVFFSQAEGYGLPVSESLWMDVPCICSDIPSHLEIAERGGCEIVTSQNEDKLATVMREWIGNPESKTVFELALKSRKHLTWRDSATAIAGWVHL